MFAFLFEGAGRDTQLAWLRGCLQFSGDHGVPGVRFKPPPCEANSQPWGIELRFLPYFLAAPFPSVITIRINRVPGGGVTHFLVMLTMFFNQVHVHLGCLAVLLAKNESCTL